jgi:hypothetical protein
MIKMDFVKYLQQRRKSTRSRKGKKIYTLLEDMVKHAPPKQKGGAKNTAKRLRTEIVHETTISDLPNELKLAILTPLSVADQIKSEYILGIQAHNTDKTNMLMAKYMYLLLYIYDVALRTAQYMLNDNEIDEEKAYQKIILHIYDDDQCIQDISFFSNDNNDDITISFTKDNTIYAEELLGFINMENTEHGSCNSFYLLKPTTTFTEKIKFLTTIEEIAEEQYPELKRKKIDDAYDTFEDKLNVTQGTFIEEMNDTWLDCSVEHVFVTYIGKLMKIKNPRFTITVKIEDKFYAEAMSRVYQNILDTFMTADISNRPGKVVIMPERNAISLPRKKRVALSRKLLEKLQNAHKRFREFHGNLLKSAAHQLGREKTIYTATKLNPLSFRFNVLLRHVLLCLEKDDTDPEWFVSKMCDWLTRTPKTTMKQFMAKTPSTLNMLTYENRYRLPTPEYFL